MSHFSVLVIGPDHEKQLAPFHEYECTGIDDEYVVDVDVTDEVEADLAKTAEAVRLADGRVFGRYDERFYTGRKADDLIKGRTSPVFVLPPGAALIEMVQRDLLVASGVSEEAWAKSEGGWFKRDGRYYNKTNPNAKWDWWVVGGRWTGTLKLKPGTRGITGRPGLLTDPPAPGYADQALAGDVDWAQMRNDAEVKARHFWKHTRKITGGASWESWDDIKLRLCGPDLDADGKPRGVTGEQREACRAEYHGQPAIELLKASKERAYSWEIDCNLALEEDTYVDIQRLKACSFYAFVQNSEWRGRGDMGWFGMSSGDEGEGQWLRRLNALIDSLAPDTQVTVVDCHI